MLQLALLEGQLKLMFELVMVAMLLVIPTAAVKVFVLFVIIYCTETLLVFVTVCNLTTSLSIQYTYFLVC